MNGPRRAGPRRARRVALALAVLLAAVPVVAPSVAAAAGATTPGRQAEAAPPLQITAVSPWVEPDGTFGVRFAPTTAVPADARLSWTVHQRLRTGPELRRTLLEAAAGRGLGGNLQAPVTRPVLELGDPATGLSLDLPVRSSRDGSERTYVPTEGIHPVELRLLSADGGELWSRVVFLNRLPEDPVVDAAGAPGRMSVTLVSRVDGGPALSPEGRPQLDVETRAELAATERLLTSVPEAPVRLALRPNLVTALQQSEDPGERRLLATLATGAAGATPVRLPYVAVDAGGLLADDAGSELARQTALGQAVVAEATGADVATDTWWLDDTLTVEAADALADLGVRRLVLAGTQLRLPQGVPPTAAATTAAGVAGVEGMTATAVDDELSLRLGASAADPVVIAHQLVTDLLGTWFAAAVNPARSFPGPAAALLVPAQTDPAALGALAGALAGGGPLTADPDAVPVTPGTLAGRTLTASLAPGAPDEQADAVASLRTTRRSLDAVRSMVGPADTELSLLGLVNDQTLSVAMTPTERAATHAAISARVAGTIGAVTAPPDRRVVVTSREAAIPLRFRNDLPYEVRVLLRARSPRLEVVGGEVREVVLAPGENRIDLPVEVRAPGQSVLRLELRTPDDALPVGAVAVPVAASTISGVGAALSVLSLLFLAGWWLRTNRRRRRDAALAAGAHPAARRRRALAALHDPAPDAGGSATHPADDGAGPPTGEAPVAAGSSERGPGG